MHKHAHMWFQLISKAMTALHRCINVLAMPINRCLRAPYTIPTHFTSYFTSYFVTPCNAWWRRSTTQQAAALRRLYSIFRYFSFHQKHRDIVVNPPLTKGRHIVGDGLDGDIGGVVTVLVHHVA